MDKRVFEKVLIEFLQKKSQRTFILKGSWGAGKTYFYKAVIEDYKKANNIDNRTFCYASVFGFSTIDEVKAQLIASSGNFKAGCFELGKVLSGFVKGQFSINVPSIATSIAEKKILKDSVICIDDLERINPQLTFDSIFGLVDRLVEQYNCQVILILNESELTDAAIAILKKYRDKVVDIELEYSPSLKDNFEIIFDQKIDQQLATIIQDILLSFNVNNIRTLRRIHEMWQWFHPYFKEFSINEKQSLIKQITILCIFRYHYGDVIDLKCLSDVHWLVDLIDQEMDGKENNKGDSKKVSIRELLSKAKFIGHMLDPIFIEYLQAGYVDMDKVRYKTEEWSKDVTSQRLRNDFYDIKKKIYDSYAMEQSEIIALMKDFLDKHAKDIGVDEYVDQIIFMEKFDSNLDQTIWIQKIIDHILESGEISQINKLSRLPTDLNQKSIIENKKKDLLRAEALVDIIRRISLVSAWNSDDFIYINEYSELELKKYFLDSDNLLSCRELEGLSEKLINITDVNQKQLAPKLLNIASDISKRSTLDEIRAKKTIANLKHFLNI